ncbi:unnamed protein product [Cylicocyclus nassatus]|uniref:Uncharacterized protein n=1 Tax=Cylicocyclus nassatus TaxID=53992 RepID=A0AA36H8G8_CYLNA|nr:unnamed protein product [Cylicocyclus nassatus]
MKVSVALLVTALLAMTFTVVVSQEDYYTNDDNSGTGSDATYDYYGDDDNYKPKRYNNHKVDSDHWWETLEVV